MVLFRDPYSLHLASCCTNTENCLKGNLNHETTGRIVVEKNTEHLGYQQLHKCDTRQEGDF